MVMLFFFACQIFVKTCNSFIHAALARVYYHYFVLSLTSQQVV
jgi:hypothetical protein